MIEELCIKKQTDYLKILNKDLITEELISLISKNCTFKFICLGSKDDVYFLSEQDYLNFKKSGISEIITYGVQKELDLNFDPIIRYNKGKKLIGNYTYFDIINENKIVLFSSLSNEQIQYLSLLKDDCIIRFEYDDYDNIFKVLFELTKYNSSVISMVTLKDKNKFNKYIFNNIDKINLNNVIVRIGSEKV